MGERLLRTKGTPGVSGPTRCSERQDNNSVSELPKRVTTADILISEFGIYSCDLPRWPSGQESTWQCRRCKTCRFDSWVRKIPWRRKHTPLFLPGKSPGQRSLVGHKEIQLCNQTTTYTYIDRVIHRPRERERRERNPRNLTMSFNTHFNPAIPRAK